MKFQTLNIYTGKKITQNSRYLNENGIVCYLINKMPKTRYIYNVFKNIYQRAITQKIQIWDKSCFERVIHPCCFTLISLK